MHIDDYNMSMKGLIKNIETQAEENENFRKVLTTGKHTQVVIMSILPKGEIGTETHPDNDQVLFLEEGSGKAILGGEENEFSKGDLVLVHAGVEHNFIAGENGMKIITTYSPSHHKSGTIHKTKEEAEKAELEE